jgi:hypothetical protein
VTTSIGGCSEDEYGQAPSLVTDEGEMTAAPYIVTSSRRCLVADNLKRHTLRDDSCRPECSSVIALGNLSGVGEEAGGRGWIEWDTEAGEPEDRTASVIGRHSRTCSSQ